jgi:hypothetical protein
MENCHHPYRIFDEMNMLDKNSITNYKKNGIKTFWINTNAIGNIEGTGIRIFKNPTSGKFIFALDSERNGRYFVYDILGKCIEKGQVDQQCLIDLSVCTSGIYILSFDSNYGYGTKKLILEK